MTSGAPRTSHLALIPLDEEISWGCSAQGWNCCVDKDIPVRPYDVHRLAEATGTSARQLIDGGTVALEWDGYGILGGWLATRPYEDGDPGSERHACIFYEEVTAANARRIRDTEPERFRALPPSVREGVTDGGEAGKAGEPADAGERRLAGLCNAHTGRPGACRGFPFQHRASEGAGSEDGVAVRVFDCGGCALAEPTTPRQVLLDNGVAEYGRADEAYRAAVQYMHKCGLANLSNSAYRQLPLPPDERLALWTNLYAGDGSYLDLLEATLEDAERLVATSGIPRDQLGGAGAPIARPDVAALLAPAAGHTS